MTGNGKDDDPEDTQDDLPSSRSSQSKALHDLASHIMIVRSELDDIEAWSNGDMPKRLLRCQAHAERAAQLIPMVRAELAGAHARLARCDCD